MKGIRSSKEIYSVLEKHLRVAQYPMTCVNLMDIPEVRESAVESYGTDIRATTNKLSDTLGFMWRRGLLTRFLAPKDGDSFAKYAYIWDKKDDARPPKPVPSPVLSKKPAMTIKENNDGSVELEFERFYVLITPKEK